MPCALVVVAVLAPGSLRAAPTPAPTVAPKVTRVLVLPLKATGVTPGVAARTTELVAQSIAVQSGYSALTTADVEKAGALQASRSLLGCQDSQECMAELSRMLAADLVVSGSVGAIGRKLSVTLFLVDPQSATHRGTASLEADGARELAQKVPAATASLMGWQAPSQARYRLPAGQRTSIAILDLTPSGVSDTTALNLTRVLAGELKRVEGTSVISREDVQAMLQMQEQKTRLGCDDMECLAEIGGALGVENIVTGSVGKLADSYMVSVRLISARHSRVDNAVTEAFSGAEEQLIRATRRAGRRLLGVESDDKGGLAVGASEPGADVLVNGVPRGQAPMPPLADLAPGIYTLQVVKDGFTDWMSDVYVEPRETTAVWAQLKARPTPWYKTWWVWTIMGGLGATAAVTLVLATGAVVVVSLAAARWAAQSDTTTASVSLR